MGSSIVVAIGKYDECNDVEKIICFGIFENIFFLTYSAYVPGGPRTLPVHRDVRTTGTVTFRYVRQSCFIKDILYEYSQAKRS